MTLYDALVERYGVNEPIFSSEITFGDYSRPWVMKQLKALCDSGQLVRFEKGIYYIPTDTLWGKSVLNPRKIIEKKYISDGYDIFGYYSGIAFQNRVKLTTQMPNVLEIYTNNETSNVRDICVGKQKVLLRRARTSINRDNVVVLSFLEMMNDISPDTLDGEKRYRIAQFVNANGITKKDVLQYAPAFPDRAMRNLIESEAIFSVAQ